MPDDLGNIIDLASARPIEQSAWFARLQRNDEGAGIPNLANTIMIFANDPELDGLLAYNAFTYQCLLNRPAPKAAPADAPLPGPYPRSWELQDIALTQAYLQRVWSPRIAAVTVEHAMTATAANRQFHPIIDWLDGLVWDGKPRLDMWLAATFDCENNRYHRAVGAKFLIAAVRRVRQPGCKFDHMLVLEGLQGIGKSRSLAALFGDEWFSDAIPPDLRSRDAALALLGVWCLEFAEIEHLIRHEVETIKAFLSRAVDRYRPPYGKDFVTRPRQGVLVGTTNSDDYLRDVSGNRRIWPVRAKVASPDWLTVNRDQLWAEACVRESRGETTWLDDEEVAGAANIAQSARMGDDPWQSAVDEFLAGKKVVAVTDILTEALFIPRERLTKIHEMRAAGILKKLGWIKTTRRQKPRRVWLEPGSEPAQEAETEGQGELIP